MVATVVPKNKGDPITMQAPPVIRAGGVLHAGWQRDPENHGQAEHRATGVRLTTPTAKRLKREGMDTAAVPAGCALPLSPLRRQAAAGAPAAGLNG